MANHQTPSYRTWNTNRIPSRVSMATGMQELKYPLLIILWTSSCTSLTVSAELGRQALSAATASFSKSFLSNSSPSLFLTNTSLIKTLSSSCRPAAEWPPFAWATTASDCADSSCLVRANEAEHKIEDFDKNRVLLWVLKVLTKWSIVDLLLARADDISAWGVNWNRGGDCCCLLWWWWWWWERGILRDEEVKRTLSFFGIIWSEGKGERFFFFFLTSGKREEVDDGFSNENRQTLVLNSSGYWNFGVWGGFVEKP